MPRVAIIGGGIGGLTAANALSRAGIEVAVYEAAAELKEIGAGVALHPNAMKVLRAIGVEDDVRRVAGRSQWQVMRNWKTGRMIGKTSRQQQVASFGIPGATVHRADLLDVLAGALPAGMVTLGRRCTQVWPDSDVAAARFADGSEIEADVSGRAAGSPCWATPRIRCSRTSDRALARPSRTARSWPRRSRSRRPTRSRAWPGTSAPAGRGQAGWCWPPANGG